VAIGTMVLTPVLVAPTGTTMCGIPTGTSAVGSAVTTYLSISGNFKELQDCIKESASLSCVSKHKTKAPKGVSTKWKAPNRIMNNGKTIL
jgi:hypothetical protein